MKLKRNLSSCTKWASILKVYFINPVSLSLFLLQLSFVYNPIFFISTWDKSYEDIYQSSSNDFVITGNVLMKIINFLPYHLLLASNRTFKTDSKYQYTIQIWRNVNEHHYYLTSTKSVIFQTGANCFPFHSANMLPFQSGKNA